MRAKSEQERTTAQEEGEVGEERRKIGVLSNYLGLW